MGSSYREEVNKYKNAKNAPFEDSGMPHVKKKGKKHKKSSHKHEYIPAIYHRVHVKSVTGERVSYDCYGFHCKHCGRVQDMHYIWGFCNGDRVDRFRKEYPDYVEINLPDEWDWFKNSCVPI